ncbi:hypothetical protein [Kribbella pratensis]|uniref:Uncharacterized protein n=1 Tax=Kribbella pratensis TaxID=2512112 RepID=A0A4R8C7F4_9ACTN|nr:hypothetical protein [Kribbella pratensis]TDW69313.1 hypothetical protein EV653_3337 [Kribbella pratensis]
MSRTRTARSIAALAAASIGITVVPIGMQTAQAAATPEGFIVDFQNSAHRLVHVSPGLIDVSPSFMDAQSSPSVVALADGNYEESFQAADHTLWIANSAAGGQQFRQNCSPNPVPEMPGTGTGIAVDAKGQVRVAWAESGQESGVNLTVGVQPQCGFTEGAILPGTTPSVAALDPDLGGFVSAWVGTDHLVHGKETGHAAFTIDTHPVAPGTSPSIATDNVSTGNHWKLAYQDTTGHLVTASSNGPLDVTPSVLAPNTSPSVSHVGRTNIFEMAFVAADNSVWVDINGGGHPIGAGLNAAPGSSPAIAQDRDGSGGWEIAYQRSTDHHLVTADSLGNRFDSGQVMEDNTTPAIAALKPTNIPPFMGTGQWQFDQQPPDNGFAAYAGSWPHPILALPAGHVIQLTYPVVGTPDSTLLFVKAGHTTAECGDPSAVVALREGVGSLTAPQLAAIFGTTRPAFFPGAPLFERFCYIGPNPPAQVFIGVTTG